MPAGCPLCGAPTGAHATVCLRCAVHPPPVERSLAVFDYVPPLSPLITALKFNGRLANARLLGQLWARQLGPRLINEPRAALLPVPLHPRRLRERGFNQALELVRPLARRLDWPLYLQAVRRIKPTAHQIGLSMDERRANLRAAFEVMRLPGKRVVIVDDVVTTGATVYELARMLRRAGAEHIEVWSLARTVQQGQA